MVKLCLADWIYADVGKLETTATALREPVESSRLCENRAVLAAGVDSIFTFSVIVEAKDWVGSEYVIATMQGRENCLDSKTL